MTNVLIVADSRSSPEMRHEVPLVIPDPFLYAEVGGKRHVAVSSFEKGRIEELGLGIEVSPWEDLGIDELIARGLRPFEIMREISLRFCRTFRVERAVVPELFPLGHADHLRAAGIELVVDAEHFRGLRRVKTD